MAAADDEMCKHFQMQLNTFYLLQLKPNFIT